MKSKRRKFLRQMHSSAEGRAKLFTSKFSPKIARDCQKNYRVDESVPTGFNEFLASARKAPAASEIPTVDNKCLSPRDGVGRGNSWLATGRRGASECLANSFDTDATSGIDTPRPDRNAILDDTADTAS
ncbi:hypothetical protein K0M31_012259 [Melipona bicolor]|uniref:Uncharacterized protein n=1 Tax=Melipona bicolor TaxID=60889 RepID=A0AA40KHL4_9HYME|nr:hypothetical protein K0M31_012259 [Melipona bicolor]